MVEPMKRREVGLTPHPATRSAPPSRGHFNPSPCRRTSAGRGRSVR